MSGADTPLAQYDALMDWLTSNSHRRFYQACAGAGLTPTQFIALDTIQDLAEPNMSTLANRLGLTPGAVTTLLDRLEKHGLALRNHDPQDRRVTCVQIESKGADALEAARRRRRDSSTAAYAHLTAAEQRQLLRSLEALKRAWQKVPEVMP